MSCNYHSKSTTGSYKSQFTLSQLYFNEQKQAANYDNLLLDNINTSIPIDITLPTTPKLYSITIKKPSNRNFA